MTSLSRLSMAAACLGLAAAFVTVPAAAQQQPRPAQSGQPPAGRPAGPPELTINVQGWEGGAYGRPDNQQFSHCGISHSFDNGITMVISMNPQFLVNVGLINPSWTLTENQQSVARIQTDGGYEQQFPAVAASRTVLVIPTGNTPQLMENLRRRNTLTITTNQGRLTFPLHGTSQSLDRLRSCVETANRLGPRAARPGATATAPEVHNAAPAQGGAAAGTAPVQGAAPGQEGQPAQSGRPTEVRLSLEALSAILTAAGLPDVWLRLPAQIPSNDMHLNYVWRTGGVVGGLHQEPRSEQVDIDGFADRYTALFSGLCPDGFERSFTPAEVIQRVYAVKTGTVECRSGDRHEFVAFFFALDDFNYSAFFHQTSLENRNAAETATAAIARVVHELATSAGHPPAEGTPEGGAAPAPGASSGSGGEGSGQSGAAPAPAQDGSAPTPGAAPEGSNPAPATEAPAAEGAAPAPTAGSGSGSN